MASEVVTEGSYTPTAVGSNLAPYSPPGVPASIGAITANPLQVNHGSAGSESFDSVNWSNRWGKAVIGAAPTETALVGIDGYSFTVVGTDSVVYISLRPGCRVAPDSLIRWQARCQLQLAPEVHIGIISRTATPFAVIPDGAWFHKSAGATTLECIIAHGAASTAAYQITAPIRGVPNSSTVWIDLGIDISGGATPGEAVVTWFLNGEPIAKVITRNAPFDADLYDAFALRSAGIISMDWIGHAATYAQTL